MLPTNYKFSYKKIIITQKKNKFVHHYCTLNILMFFDSGLKVLIIEK